MSTDDPRSADILRAPLLEQEIPFEWQVVGMLVVDTSREVIQMLNDDGLHVKAKRDGKDYGVSKAILIGCIPRDHVEVIRRKYIQIWTRFFLVGPPISLQRIFPPGEVDS